MSRSVLGTIIYKGVAGIESMWPMTYEFNQEKVVENLYLGEIKILSTEKSVIVEMEPMNVDNFPIFLENSKREI